MQLNISMIKVLFAILFYYMYIPVHRFLSFMYSSQNIAFMESIVSIEGFTISSYLQVHIYYLLFPVILQVHIFIIKVLFAMLFY